MEQAEMSFLIDNIEKIMPFKLDNKKVEANRLYYDYTTRIELENGDYCFPIVQNFYVSAGSGIQIDKYYEDDEGTLVYYQHQDVGHLNDNRFMSLSNVEDENEGEATDQ